MKIGKKNIWNLFAVMIVMVMAMVACGARDVSTAYCVAEITYNGEVIDDGLTWPGQSIRDLTLDGSSRLYIPCGYRNYVISDGKVTNPNGTVLGDRTEPILLSLPGGKLVEVYASAYWTLNQGKDELKEFIKFQKKYNALASDMSGSGNVYSSTPGWNDMLLENFSPTMDSVARQAIQNVIKNPPMSEDETHQVIINDNIWKTQDTEQWKALANEMSNLFADNIAKRVGTDLDLFCGSNKSTGWTDPSTSMAGKPGNKFECAPVIIEVTYVQPANSQVDTGSQSIIDSNQQRYDAAYKLYGDQTACWLGIQDAINACTGNSTPCTFIIDANACTPPIEGAGQDVLILPNYPTATPSVEGGTVTAP